MKVNDYFPLEGDTTYDSLVVAVATAFVSKTSVVTFALVYCAGRVRWILLADQSVMQVNNVTASELGAAVVG